MDSMTTKQKAISMTDPTQDNCSPIFWLSYPILTQTKFRYSVGWKLNQLSIL